MTRSCSSHQSPQRSRRPLALPPEILSLIIEYLSTDTRTLLTLLTLSHAFHSLTQPILLSSITLQDDLTSSLLLSSDLLSKYPTKELKIGGPIPWKSKISIPVIELVLESVKGVETLEMDWIFKDLDTVPSRDLRVSFLRTEGLKGLKSLKLNCVAFAENPNSADLSNSASESNPIFFRSLRFLSIESDAFRPPTYPCFLAPELLTLELKAFGHEGNHFNVPLFNSVISFLLSSSSSPKLKKVHLSNQGSLNLLTSTINSIANCKKLEELSIFSEREDWCPLSTADFYERTVAEIEGILNELDRMNPLKRLRIMEEVALADRGLLTLDNRLRRFLSKIVKEGWWKPSLERLSYVGVADFQQERVRKV